MRLSLSALGALALASVVASCGNEAQYAKVVVDLNRTVSGTASIVAAVASQPFSATLSADGNGVYSFASDTLPEGIYAIFWEEANLAMPLYVRPGQEVKVCGTAAEWDAKTTSQHETRLLWAADALRSQLDVMRDSARAAHPVLSVAAVEALADSLRTIRSVIRSKADKVLEMVPDSSILALPILGLDGVYDPVADYDIFRRRADAMLLAHPEVAIIDTLRGRLAEVAMLRRVRERYRPGSPMPDFDLLVGNDTVEARSAYRRRYVVALLRDSVSSARRAMPQIVSMASEGTRVFLQAPDGVTLPEKVRCFRGALTNLPELDVLEHFAPALLVVGTDGTVESLRLGESMRQQHGADEAIPKPKAKVKPKAAASVSDGAKPTDVPPPALAPLSPTVTMQAAPTQLIQ